MSLATRLKELRERRKLSQNALSKILNISQPTIGFYERGERLPDAGFIKDFCLYMNVSADWLIFGDQVKSEKNADVGDCKFHNNLNLQTDEEKKPPTPAVNFSGLSQLVEVQQDLIQAYKETVETKTKVIELSDVIANNNTELATLKTKNEQLEREKDRLLERILELERRPSAASATPAPDAPEANPINEKTRVHFSVVADNNNNQPPKP